MSRSAEVIRDVRPAPLLTAALIQGIAAAAVLAMADLDPSGGVMGWWPWLAGALAALMGAIAGMPAWWLPVNLLLPPVARALLDSGIPASAYLAAFVVLWLANAAAWRNRVPLYLSGRAAIAALLPLLPSRPGFRLLDVGCGTASVLASLVRARPDGRYHGVELAPLPFALAWWRARRHELDVTWSDFWYADLSCCDVVYAYLSPAAMPGLWRKARREMRPGTLLVSNSFEVPGVAPAQVIGYSPHRNLYVWRM